MGCNITLVNQLICQQSHTWNFPILKSKFSEREVDAIVSMPLSIRRPEDKLIWHFDKKGKFSVKSTNQIAWKWQTGGEVAASSSGPNTSADLWKKIWAARIPPKVKLCAWRFCRDIIPSRANLNRRHINTELSCVLCNGQVESSVHLIKDCCYASCVWLSTAIRKPPSGGQCSSVLEWGFFLASTLSPSNYDLCLMVWWAIWGAWNAMLWNGKSEKPDYVVARAIS